MAEKYTRSIETNHQEIEFKNLDDFFTSPQISSVIQNLSNKLSEELMSRVLGEKLFYDAYYRVEDDEDIDKIWLNNCKELLTECINLALQEPSLNTYHGILFRFRDDVLSAASVSEIENLNAKNAEIKKFTDNIIRKIQYKSGNLTSFFGQVEPTKVVLKVKKWLKQEVEEKQDTRFGFLTEDDKAIFEKTAPELLKIINEGIEKGNPAKTYVYLTTGSRLLPYFVRGLIENNMPKDIPKPETRYIQCSRDADHTEKDLIAQRVKEVVETTEPPYLIIDDYATQKHATCDIIKEAFQKAGVKEEDVTFFAFIAEKENLWSGEKIPAGDYTRAGIHFGTQDKYGSFADFLFNKNDTFKGTRKNIQGKYETVILKKDSDTVYDKYTNATSPDVRKNIRKSLYYLGISLAKKQQSKQ